MTPQLAALAVMAGLALTLVLAGLRRRSPETFVSDGRVFAMPDLKNSLRSMSSWARHRLVGDLERKHALRQDAAMMGRTLEAHALAKLGGMAGAAVLIVVVALLMNAVIGVEVPPLLVVMLAAVASLGGWWVPDSMLKTEAEKAREVFRQTSEAWLELVAQLVTAGADTHAALGLAADYSEQPAFVAIRNALAEAAARGEAPWDGLRRLSDAQRLKSLDPFVAALELAGTTGAGARQAILSQVDAARAKSLAAAEAKAASASEKMGGPLALIGGAFMMLMGYPPLAGILSSDTVTNIGGL